MADFDVAAWWAALTDAERELALRRRDDDPLHPEVVCQLEADGVTVETERGWHWAPEVKDFLDGGCE